ncbi:MAG TPA: hypothetical protein DCO79_05820, partial [Spirochaeta sp.]|nr:hypothetical protein [Spirochaeta sp.]
MNSLIHLRLSKLIITLFFIFTTGFLQAQTIAGPPNPVYSSSVPASISVQPNGADDVLMTTLRYNASAPLCFSQIQIILNSNNQALIDTQISDVNVYYDTNANDLFDSSVDALLDFGATNTFTDGVYTLSIPLNPAIISGTGWNRLFVAFDFANIIDSGSTVGCDIDSVTYGASGGPGTGGTNSPFSFTAVNSTGAIDDYRISDSYTDRAPATATQADSDVPIMNIDLDFTNASEISASADIDSITITRIGTSSVDADVTSVSLYNDNGTTAGEVDGGDTLLDTKTVAGGTATFDPVANITFAGDGAGSGLSLLVCMTLDANADANTTIGFSLVSPGNADPDLNGDLVFLDEFDDTLNQSSPAYVQKGIVTNTTSFSSSLIDILEYVEPDLTPPTLDSSIPASGATGVDNVSDIQVTFSETVTNVDGASVFT